MSTDLYCIIYFGINCNIAPRVLISCNWAHSLYADITLHHIQANMTTKCCWIWHAACSADYSNCTETENWKYGVGASYANTICSTSQNTWY